MKLRYAASKQNCITLRGARTVLVAASYLTCVGFYRAMHFSAKRGIAIACSGVTTDPADPAMRGGPWAYGGPKL